MKRLSGPLLIGPIIVLVAIFGAAALVNGWSASDPPSPRLLVRGTPVDMETFSLSTLQAPQDRDSVQSTRRELFATCMRQKGFNEPPREEAGAYADAYGLAAAGDDPSVTKPPPPRTIEIAPGTAAEVRTTWTPDTCFYRSYAELGVDPLVYEALRMRITGFINRADAEAESALSSIASEWGDCFGERDALAKDLLNVIDGDSLERVPRGAEAVRCASEEMRAKAVRIRAPYHVEIARNNQEIVDAWVRLLETETRSAHSASP